MSCPFAHGKGGPTRRGLLAGAGGLLAGASATRLARAAQGVVAPAAPVEAFFGPHQGGIVMPQQANTYFVAFDVSAKTRDELTAMLRLWTDAAARMTAGETARPIGDDPSIEGEDGGSALGLKASRLTVTFGFGAGLFVKDGVDRYGLAAERPEALVELPKFLGDQQLQPARTGGDLSVQACADDPMVAFHALRELDRLSYGAAQIRWAQAGFMPDTPEGETPRNLMGFKDGTNNPPPAGVKTTPDAPRGFDEVVWVGDEGPNWMRGGSYVVARRIRISLEHWDRSEIDFQEQVIGRHKYSGAPIGKANEQDLLNLDRVDKDGNPIIADNAHVRLGAPEANDGAQILRRSYSYNDGVAFTAERWPPWRQGMLYDAGLLFICYQRDPRTGFIKIFEPMSKLDALNQFTTHTGGGLFACPRGVRRDEFIGQELF